jgi:hypothetical protein
MEEWGQKPEALLLYSLILLLDYVYDKFTHNSDIPALQDKAFVSSVE